VIEGHSSAEKWSDHRRRCAKDNAKTMDKLIKHERGRWVVCEGKLAQVSPEVQRLFQIINSTYISFTYWFNLLLVLLIESTYY